MSVEVAVGPSYAADSPRREVVGSYAPDKISVSIPRFEDLRDQVIHVGLSRLMIPRQVIKRVASKMGVQLVDIAAVELAVVVKIRADGVIDFGS